MMFYGFIKKLEKYEWIINKPVEILYWVMDGTNAVPICPPPIPIPGVSKSLLPRGNKNKKEEDIRWFPMIVMKKSKIDKYFIKKTMKIL